MHCIKLEQNTDVKKRLFFVSFEALIPLARGYFSVLEVCTLPSHAKLQRQAQVGRPLVARQ